MSNDAMKKKNYNVGRRYSDIEKTELEWIWKGVLPVGKIVLISGNQGDGKSFFTCHIAAHVTSGKQWDNGYPCLSGGVVLCTPEDNPEDTIYKKLEDSGTNLDKVLDLSRVSDNKAQLNSGYKPFNLHEHIEQLEQAIYDIDARIVILDTMRACSIKYTNSIMSKPMSELAELAKKTGVCIICLGHLKPGPIHPENMITRLENTTVHAWARKSFLLHKMGNVRTLTDIKSNLDNNSTPLTYRIVENEQGQVYVELIDAKEGISLADKVQSNGESRISQKIIAVLEQNNCEMTVPEIRNILDIPYNHMTTYLGRLIREERIIKHAHGIYCSKAYAASCIQTTSQTTTDGETTKTTKTTKTTTEKI